MRSAQPSMLCMSRDGPPNHPANIGSMDGAQTLQALGDVAVGCVGRGVIGRSGEAHEHPWSLTTHREGPSHHGNAAPVCSLNRSTRRT
jgi:hypothetical protein